MLFFFFFPSSPICQYSLPQPNFTQLTPIFPSPFLFAFLSHFPPFSHPLFHIFSLNDIRRYLFILNTWTSVYIKANQAPISVWWKYLPEVFSSRMGDCLGSSLSLNSWSTDVSINFLAVVNKTISSLRFKASKNNILCTTLNEGPYTRLWLKGTVLRPWDGSQTVGWIEHL